MRWRPSFPPRLDSGIAAGLSAAGLVEAAIIDTVRPWPVHAALTTAVMAALAWRRRFPLAVLTVALLGMVAVDGVDAPVTVFAAVVIASYSAGAVLEGAKALLGLCVAVVPLAVGIVVDGGQPADVVAVVVLYGGAWSLGRLVQERTRRADAMAEKAARLERHDDQRRAEAAAEERARIARELHDIVSHSISVIAVQTQAVRRRLDPEQGRERDDLRAVEATARQAMGEMRRLLGVLRTDGERPPLAPQPGLDQLPRLLEGTQAAGLPVELKVTGEAVPLPPGVDLAAYRIVQEALTNALKHAGAARVRVALGYGEHELEVRVDDDGGGPTGGSDGHGLIGMRERVRLYGGRLEVDGRPGGGFSVHANLPMREAERL